MATERTLAHSRWSMFVDPTSTTSRTPSAWTPTRSAPCWWPPDSAPPPSTRGHRTLTIVRKGGKIATIPIAPRTARAIGLAIGERARGPTRAWRLPVVHRAALVPGSVAAPPCTGDCSDAAGRGST